MSKETFIKALKVVDKPSKVINKLTFMIIYALIYIKMQMHQSVHMCAQILQNLS